MTSSAPRSFVGRIRAATVFAIAACACAAAIASATAPAQAAGETKPAPSAAATAGASAAEPKPADAKSAPSIAGDWLGALEVQGQALHLAIHLTKNEDGSLGATLAHRSGAKGDSSRTRSDTRTQTHA
jgi:hypothetical protein